MQNIMSILNNSQSDEELTLEQSLSLESINDENHIETLVLSSGGLEGIYFLGALEECYRTDKLSNIKHYIGCSVGAMLSYLMNIGYTPKELIELILNIDFQRDLFNFNINNIAFNYGIDDGKKIENLLDILTEARSISKNITFLNLFKLTNKRLTITCTLIDTNDVLYMDYENCPNIRVIDAIIGSSSIPFILKPRKIDTIGTVIDGAVKDYFPIQLSESLPNHTLGITINNWEKINPENNMLHGLLRCFSTIGLKDLSIYKDRIIDIKVTNINHFSMFELGNFDKNKILIMIKVGRDAVINYFKLMENIDYKITSTILEDKYIK